MSKPRHMNELGGTEYLCLCCAVTEQEFRGAVEEFHITKPTEIKGLNLIGGFCNKCMKPAINILKDINNDKI